MDTALLSEDHGMKIVEPDYIELLVQAHRRWIRERTAEAGNNFDRALWASIKADVKPRAGIPLLGQ
jgi:hypothetical protein